MARIEFKNDVTKALEEMEGSDGRMNVSSRSDSRAYYNSRDVGQCYSMTFEHLAAIDGEISFYLQNTSTTKTMVISSIGVNGTLAARFQLYEVTGTAAGADVVPHNLNFTSSFDAAAVAKIDTGGAISGVSPHGICIDDLQLGAAGHEEFRLGDRVRLGQTDAIALYMKTTATVTDAFGVIFFYFE